VASASSSSTYAAQIADGIKTAHIDGFERARVQSNLFQLVSALQHLHALDPACQYRRRSIEQADLLPATAVAPRAFRSIIGWS
jgi:hypothetical protein